MALTQVTPDVLHNIQSNVTQVGTLSNLSVTGNITSGNVTATNFTGTASLANNASFLGGTAAANYALGSTVTTANTNMKGYVDGQISTTSSNITTANTNMKGYVDAANTIQSNQIGWANASISAANTAITTANTNMKGYVDGQISTTTTAITTANTAMKGYVDAVTTAWTANAGAQAGSIASKANSNQPTLTGYIKVVNTSTGFPLIDLEGSQAQVRLASTDGGWGTISGSGNNLGLKIQMGVTDYVAFEKNNGFVGFNTENPTARLHVIGNAIVTGNITATNFLGTATTATTASNAIGHNQTWQNLSASRASGTTYTNSTGRPIFISVKWERDDGTLSLTVDGLEIGRTGTTAGPQFYTLTAIIPAGSTYSATAVGGGGVLSWYELR